METYKVIGVMSGSSLDGIDLVYAQFNYNNETWTYEVLQSEFFPYPTKWKLRLRKLVLQNAITYIKTHTFLGHYFGEVIRDFINKYDIRNEVDFIASHGHTIFHQPENLLTSQIGDGAAIASKAGVPVICNFRTTDVSLGGQGAPIVPIGDKHLFAQYPFCLNLGGIANISFKATDGRMIAYDICACNLLLNHLANRLGKEYDPEGQFAESGELHPELLEELNHNWYYTKNYPKTLSGGWVSKVVLPIFRRFRMRTEDKLRTVCEHIAIQIGKDIDLIYRNEKTEAQEGDAMLVTGGGAFNTFLMERISEHSSVKVVIPDDVTVTFKEALVMGFLGVLRVRGEVNCLASVTGASKDNIGGIIYQGGDRLLLG